MAVMVGLSGGMARAVEAPVLTPQVADSPTALDVGVDSPETGVVLRYTLDGRDPEVFDPVVEAGGTLTVARSAVVKARAWLGGAASEVTTGDYRITGAVASGYQHGLALSVGGKVWSWGRRDNGRLGNGSFATGNQPVPAPALAPDGVSNLGGVADIAAGHYHSLTLGADGRVRTFGYNLYGALGDGTWTSAALPVEVLEGPGAPLADVEAIAGGQDFSLALDAGGGVLAWGSNGSARTGQGLTWGSTYFALPVLRGDDPAFPPLDGIRGIAAGMGFGMAREPNALEEPAGEGRVGAWEANSQGQLGQGNTIQLTRAALMRFADGTPVDHVIAMAGGEQHAAVVRWDPDDAAQQGTVWCCGNRYYGRLGNGAGGYGQQTSPVQVVRLDDGQPLTGIVGVAIGAAHTLAVDLNGGVWAWGANDYGQLGQGDTTDRAAAVRVKSREDDELLEDIVAVAAGGLGVQGASMALAADGTIWVWGRNDQGQLGTGYTNYWVGLRLPVEHDENIIDEGAPSVSLSGTVVDPVEAGEILLAASPSHSGPFGAAHIARVDFHVNGSFAGSATGSPWQLSVDSLPAGTGNAVAVVTDHDGVQAMSSPWSFEIELDPLLDADGDGLSNGAEINDYLTDPLNPDTDGDGMEDGYENWHGFSPLSLELGTSKASTADFDGDGMSNKDEHDVGRVALMANESFAPLDFIFTHELRWFGRSDFWYTVEVSTDLQQWQAFEYGFIGTNHELVVDIDQWLGGLPSPSGFFRLRYGPATLYDADGDGLSAAVELAIGTDPTRADTSGDGISDGWAVAHGLDPLADNADGLFQGGPTTNLEAFQAGVQAAVGADMDDFDGDGIINEEDADPRDSDVTWPPAVASAYALIDIEAPLAEGPGLELNDKGEVLFENGIWASGAWEPREGFEPIVETYQGEEMTITWSSWKHFNTGRDLLGLGEGTDLWGSSSLTVRSLFGSPPDYLGTLDDGSYPDPFGIEPRGIDEAGRSFCVYSQIVAWHLGGGSETFSRLLMIEPASQLGVEYAARDDWYPLPFEDPERFDVSRNGWVTLNTAEDLDDEQTPFRPELWNHEGQRVALPEELAGLCTQLSITELVNGATVMCAKADGALARVLVGQTSGQGGGPAMDLADKLSQHGIIRFAPDGTGMTADNRIWRNGILHPLGDLSPLIADLIAQGRQIFPIDSNIDGAWLVEVRDPSQASPGLTKLLLPVEVAPEVLAVNSDFDEGRIGAVGPQDTGANEDRQNTSLIAERDSVDGRIKAGDVVTDDLHDGWFGVPPDTLPSDFFDGATVTIKKIEKNDPETGEPEKGQVRFYATWADNSEMMIEPYSILGSIAGTHPPPTNLVGIVYGGSAAVPAGAEFWMEGTQPGKITLEWRLQKGSIDVRHEQTFLVCSQWSREEWQAVVRDELYLDGLASVGGLAVNGWNPGVVDIDNYVVGNGFLNNRAYLYSVYEYYAKLHDDEPDQCLWAGRAKLAGAPVYAGLSDAQNGRSGLAIGSFGIIDDPILAEIQDLLIEANINIFEDLAYQFVAYRSSGICALEHLNEEGVIPNEIFAGWWSIHDGFDDNDFSAVADGNQQLLRREQEEILKETYEALDEAEALFGTVSVSWLFSLLTDNPVPGGPSFQAVVPDGNIAVFADRWQWITDPNVGMWKLWTGTDKPSRRAWAGLPLRTRADQFNIVAPLR